MLLDFARTCIFISGNCSASALKIIYNRLPYPLHLGEKTLPLMTGAAVPCQFTAVDQSTFSFGVAVNSTLITQGRCRSSIGSNARHTSTQHTRVLAEALDSWFEAQQHTGTRHSSHAPSIRKRQGHMNQALKPTHWRVQFHLPCHDDHVPTLQAPPFPGDTRVMSSVFQKRSTHSI